MMRNTFLLVCMLVEMIFAAKHANSGDVAGTILYCFSAYLCLQFMTKGKDGDGK